MNDSKLIEKAMPIQRILNGLNEFQNNYSATHQSLFEQLSRGQSPEILFIKLFSI